MSDYQPKVGDKVMVGENGPLHAVPQGPSGHRSALFDDRTGGYVGEVPTSWLTPAPEPEPDEPTAPGALVRDDYDHLWVRDDDTWRPWNCMTDMTAGPKEWHGLNRPCVILADPAEVEVLREERDELQRRIDKVIAYCDDPGNWGTYEGRRWLIASWLRGE